MAYSKVQIISLALDKIGKDPINAIGNKPIEVTADLVYTALLGAELSTGIWRFAVRLADLPLTTTVPILPSWRYAYQLPADFGRLWRLHPQTYNFEIFQGNYLYSNVTPLVIEYSSLSIDATELPWYFIDFFVFALADRLSLGNAQNPQLVGALEGKALQLRTLALAVDAQNRPCSAIVNAPVITSRFRGWDGTAWENGPTW